METIISWLQGALSYAVPMIILLGLLIFVHELGHFLVAKYYKVRVEVFSLGFGPKLFKFKRGDTVYAISAIPLGGYVKMFGDDPSADVTSDQKPHSFIHKPVGQRIAVVLAGPLMNLFFAVLLFAGVASVGEIALAPKLGDIEATTPAFTLGFRSGDTVLSVGSNTIRTWDEMQKAIETNADKPLTFVVERGVGIKETIQATPKLVKNKNVLSWDREIGEIEGLSEFSRASVVGILGPKSSAAIDGLVSADEIKSIDGTNVSKWREVIAAIEKRTGNVLSVEVTRAPPSDSGNDAAAVTQKLTLHFSESSKGKPGEEQLRSIGVEFPELFLSNIQKGSPAETAGLKRGDRIVSIDGKPVSTFDQVASIIRSYGQTVKGQASQKDAAVTPLTFAIDREGNELTIKVAPSQKERMSPQGREERRFEIGISPMIAGAAPSTFDLSFTGLAILKRGASQTWKWTSLTVLSFVRLFQNEVSPKNIGGFLSIGQMAKRAAQIGLSQFMNVMAIISINLFILNLLPVPVLDGGHLVFYSIELLRGAPLSMRKMEIAQQVGLVLLLGLMVFALFNDFTRILN